MTPADLITPTVGRSVHYYPSAGDQASTAGNAGPWHAVVIDVVNHAATLKVTSPYGKDLVVYGVTYSSDPMLGTWTWPPRV